eukprot:scaffold19680_cov100-Isochrysis_galbana.AAC.3
MASRYAWVAGEMAAPGWTPTSAKSSARAGARRRWSPCLPQTSAIGTEPERSSDASMRSYTACMDDVKRE